MSQPSTSRRHRAPFRPIDTLSSPHKPDSVRLRDDLSYLPESDTIDHVEPEYLGNSSSLFDEDYTHSPLESVSKHHSRYPAHGRKGGTMVRERDPPGAPPRAEPPVSKPLQAVANAAPEFGKPSMPQSPFKTATQSTTFSHLFNQPKPGQSRPEHHRDHKPIAIHRPMAQSGGHANSKGGPQRSYISSDDDDILEIPAAQFQSRVLHAGGALSKPTNPAARTVQPPPRPLFSSMGHTNGFQPVNRPQPTFNDNTRKTVILNDVEPKRTGSDDEDNFDPDAEIRAESGVFGAPDMEAYVDAARANENIKELLEGAFDQDNDKIPRTRGRKKRKQEQERSAGASLADRLAALDVKEDEKEPAGEEDGEDEEDDGTVDGMQIKLLPHQVEGVAWMIEKETGAHNKRAKLPKGGILADDMGLGKTVQSMALILSNPRPDKGAAPENKKNKILPTVGHGTLIVAPLALIKQWESEINTKVSKSHNLKVLVHHGPNRTKSAEKLKTYDVVITTYQVLASEHASSSDGPNGIQRGCFGVHWYRMMLDEAHTIKNRNAKMTKACYEVKSHYRWCLTGTPMQNNLDELQSLIRFLRIEPYCNMSNWKESITGPMKNGRGNLAMRRLQIFLKAFMKRRTKDVLKKEGALNFGGKSKEGEKKEAFQIVARNVENIMGEFTAKERYFYDRLNDRAESRLREMMGSSKQDVIGALVLLLRLRQACNHPNLTKSNMKNDHDAITTGQKPGSQAGLQTPRKSRDGDADDLADLLGGLSVQTKRCDFCQTALTRNNAAAGAIRCDECENDLHASVKKVKKSKKHRTDKHKEGSEKTHASSKASAVSRPRRVIVDSDDEEEASGEWLVGEDEQGPTSLGKAGGTDDENAEGGGDTLASIDPDSSVTEDGETMGSFIVHDTDSEEEGPIVRKRGIKKHRQPQNTTRDSDDDASQGGDDSGSEGETEEESETDASDIEYNASDLTPSTKIRQLLTILEKETPDHKVIVFSQFTSMLDLIEPFLRREAYNFTRYDGSMRNDLREASLHKLRSDKRCRILLCSLKCGSLGLNLTAASRVVIMEPFWNPFVEEQAIDRVHRLNQTVDVTVYRLSIHNSVEERILALQESKRKLAAAALEGGKGANNLSMKDILALFKRDAEYDHRNVDDGSEADLYTKRRVLDSGSGGSVSPFDGAGDTTAPRKKAGTLGFKKPEDSVWGRR